MKSQATPVETQRLVFRIVRPIVLGVVVTAMTAAIAGTSISGPTSRPIAASSGGRTQSGSDAVQLREAPSAAATLSFNPGSSVKVQQIIGDCDWAVMAAGGTCQQTASLTISKANVAANDIGDSFEQGGKLVFMFGDTKSNDPSQPWSTSKLPLVDYHQHDPVATTDVTDGEAPLALNFLLTSPPGAPVPTPFFVEPSYADGTKVAMGADDVPHAGIEFNNKTYVVVNTGADLSLNDPHQNSFSVLTSWDGTTNSNAFTALRTISKLPGGHFIINSLQELAPGEAGSSDTMQGILTYGIGEVRASNVYLSFDPAIANLPAVAGAPGYEAGGNTMYLKGLDDAGQPIWSTSESDAMPVVKDVVDPPTIAHLSVSYSKDLGLWLMTFDGGRTQQPDGTQTNGSPATDGVYFTYAPAPWGPWAQPQLIFNAIRDNGFG
ncbi:MAG: hypothetical protein ACREAC_20780, partial [Blastocatellia bacterium]